MSGIKHFHALSNKRRSEFIEYPERFFSQEKVDGSNFIIGCDDGQLWTSRHNDQNRYPVNTIMKWDDRHLPRWPQTLWAAKFRMAHDGVQDAASWLMVEYGQNFILHCEILSKIIPNALEYHIPNDSSHNDQFAMVIYKAEVDGVEVKPRPLFGGRDYVASCSIVHYLTPTLIMEDLGEYQISSTSVYVDWWFTALQDYIPPTWLAKGMSISWSVEQQQAHLLKAIEGLKGNYGADRIEGLVVKHSTDNWGFKIVDSEWFLALTEKEYRARKRLFKTPRRTSNSVADVLARNIADGLPEPQAKLLALAQLQEEWARYRLEMRDYRPTTRMRNVEAFYSMYMELTS